MTSYDVIVLGGGIVGAATAWALRGRGQRVLLVEQFGPGHMHGSSHGDGRIIRFAYPEAIYVEMALLAYPAWAELAAQAGRPLVQRSGGWDCGPADSPALTELEHNFQHFGIPYERLTAAESHHRFPHFRLPEGSKAIFQADAGVVFATPAVQALWRLFQAAGGEALTNTRVARAAVDGAGVALHTVTGETLRAGRLVLAAGGWARGLLEALDLPLPLDVTQEQVAYFAPIKGPDHRVGAMPVFIDYHTEQPFYGLPQIEVPGVKIGWHHMGLPVDPDVPREWDALNATGVSCFVKERFPFLDPQPIEQATCLYTNTPDYHFILDRHPAYPQIVIGSACSGHGFKFGPVVGQILAALALDEPPPLPLETFTLARFGSGAELQRRIGA